MEQSIDRNKFVPISQLSDEYNKLSGRGVSENTIRNYIRQYPEMFNIVRDGQTFVELIPALEAIKSIRSTVSSGRRKACNESAVLSGEDWDRIEGMIREVVTEVVTEVVKGGQSEK